MTPEEELLSRCETFAEQWACIAPNLLGVALGQAAAAIRALILERDEALAAMSADTADVALACAALRAQLAEARRQYEILQAVSHEHKINADEARSEVERLKADNAQLSAAILAALSRSREEKKA